MHHRRIVFVLALLSVAAPVRAQEGDVRHRSPSMVLFSVDAVAPGGSYEMLMLVRDRGGSTFGAGAAVGLLPRVRVAAQLAVRRTSEPVGLGRDVSGWYAGASLLGLWTLAGNPATGLDLLAGVQFDHSSHDDASRTSAPVGLTARVGREIGGINMQPFAGGGVALRRDNVHALREWSSPTAADGTANIGWFAHIGARIGTGRFWVQPAMTWSRVLDHDAFPASVVRDDSGDFASAAPLVTAAPLFSIKAGFTP